MPGIQLTVSGDGDTGRSEHFAAQLSALTCSVLDKKLANTMVMVRYVPHAHWFIGGQSLAALGQNSFRLEVTLTEETNTKDQKASYHRQAFELLSSLIGNVHPHSNVHIVDCAATSYGYGGLTQEYRYQHGKTQHARIGSESAR
ncbi:tautomerase family protein [Pararobbsia silviterrae]|uniref:4-oxalocrotonate tautomerase n=1 Tax=Pararobbsia silviterrae TaxID=1792498 RepID=A0A494X952_9BURK|nr:tautomerase family protein [Pararobbsia silviterrae]RKP47098.1 4-oxalocrotonate tautomerase [Pararobbsia silviterrae]